MRSVICRAQLRNVPDHEANHEPGRLSQIDERVQAELVQPASHQFVEPRLRHSQAACGFGLIDLPALDLS